LQLITVYPNPVKGILSINLPASLNSDLEVAIHDVKGNNIFSKFYSPSSSFEPIALEVVNLKQGINFISIVSNTELFVAKFYKQ
jgi:hypothetical protein